MAYQGDNVPHLVIEVNQKCNISCKACYKALFNYTKPLDVIKKEVDFATTQRKLHIITLAGGEPTLHPDLPEIINYISEKGIWVDMLSNGHALSDKKLGACKKAGLNKIYLHIDAQQKRPDLKENYTEKDLNDLRTTISDKILSHGIKCALEITLYKKDLTNFSEFIDYYLETPNYRNLLVTCCTDFDIIANKHNVNKNYQHKDTNNDLSKEVVSNREVIEILYNQYKMLPYAFLPSTKNKNEMRWIFYLSFVINFKNGKTKALHTKNQFRFLARLGNNLYFKKKKKYPFDIVWNRSQILKNCLLFGLMSYNIFTLFKVLFFLSNILIPGAKITYKTFCFQQGPNLTIDGDIEFCSSCPDVTIRNNKLVPVCMVDFLSEKSISEY